MAQDGCDGMGCALTLWVTRDRSKECARTMDKRKKVTGTSGLPAKQPALTPRVSAEKGAGEVAWVRAELKPRQSEEAPPGSVPCSGAPACSARKLTRAQHAAAWNARRNYTRSLIG